jgi:hypothetical protein
MTQGTKRDSSSSDINAASYNSFRIILLFQKQTKKAYTRVENFEYFFMKLLENCLRGSAQASRKGSPTSNDSQW